MLNVKVLSRKAIIFKPWTIKHKTVCFSNSHLHLILKDSHSQPELESNEQLQNPAMRERTSMRVHESTVRKPRALCQAYVGCALSRERLRECERVLRAVSRIRHIVHTMQDSMSVLNVLSQDNVMSNRLLSRDDTKLDQFMMHLDGADKWRLKRLVSLLSWAYLSPIFSGDVFTKLECVKTL